MSEQNEVTSHQGIEIDLNGLRSMLAFAACRFIRAECYLLHAEAYQLRVSLLVGDANDIVNFLSDKYAMEVVKHQHFGRVVHKNVFKANDLSFKLTIIPKDMSLKLTMTLEAWSQLFSVEAK